MKNEEPNTKNTTIGDKFNLTEWLMKWYYDNGFNLLTKSEIIQDAIQTLQEEKAK